MLVHVVLAESLIEALIACLTVHMREAFVQSCLANEKLSYQ